MSKTFVQGDTAPDIESVIHLEDDPTAITNLTNAESVRFQMRKVEDHRYTVDAAATVVGDPLLGQVSYSWGPNDLNVPGTYNVQWEVHWLGGRTQTTAPEVQVTVRRQ